METKTISTYEQQAIDFLEKTNTELSIEFEKFDYYFQDDEHKRNIFKATLKNKKHSYAFNFGASLNDSLKNVSDIIHGKKIDFFVGLKFENYKKKYLSFSKEITIETFKNKTANSFIKGIEKEAEEIYNRFVDANTYKPKYGPPTNVNFPFSNFLLRIKEKFETVAEELRGKNFGEPIQADEIVKPTAYDILTCLTKYDPGTFEDFCSEFWYDTDSRKAEKTYNAVKEEWLNVSRLFNDDELAELQEIN